MSVPNQWFAAELVALVLLGLFWTFWLRSAPFSDFLLYWDEAGGSAAYERGGAGVLVFALVRRFLSAPQWAALCVNLPAAAFLLWLFWQCDTTRWRVFAHLGALYLLLITPYFGLVQIDLIATAWLAACWALLLRPPPAWPRSFVLALAFASGAAAVSTRPQFALTLSVLIGLLVIAWLLFERRPERRLLIVSAMLAATVVAGFSLDLWARHAAGTSERVRTSSAVTLYAGLLASEDGSSCGFWTPRATAAAAEDRGMHLSEAVGMRLAKQPAGHWLGIMRCKLVRYIVLPEPFALYWAMEPLAQAAQTAPTADQARRLAVAADFIAWEKGLYFAVTLGAYFSALAAFAVGWRRARGLAVLPIAWVLSFWLVHLVFEVQGRYFLATILLLPLLSALTSGFGTPRRSEAPQSGG